MGDPFTEDEVHNAINQMPSDKAPGPDGFTGVFFKRCWSIIKGDIMKVIGRFGELHVHNSIGSTTQMLRFFPRRMGRKRSQTLAH
jgi:hypothetical protein